MIIVYRWLLNQLAERIMSITITNNKYTYISLSPTLQCEDFFLINRMLILFYIKLLITYYVL